MELDSYVFVLPINELVSAFFPMTPPTLPTSLCISIVVFCAITEGAFLPQNVGNPTAWLDADFAAAVAAPSKVSYAVMQLEAVLQIMSRSVGRSAKSGECLNEEDHIYVQGELAAMVQDGWEDAQAGSDYERHFYG